MIRNYLTVALRNLWRHRSYSINSIVSLAASLAVCLLFVLLLYNQWQFDRHHQKADRLYRVVSTATSGSFASSPAPLAATLEEQYAAVEEVTRVTSLSSEAIIEGAGLEFRGYYAEPSLLRLFDWPIQSGASPEALAQPNQVFLSAEWAEQAFDTGNPVGKALELDGIGTVTVAGVLDEPPGPTHLESDLLLSFPTLERQQPEWVASWQDSFWNCHNYILLAPNSSPETLDAAFAQVRAEHFPDASPGTYTFRLQSITDIALGPWLSNDPAQGQGLLPGIAVYFLGGLVLLVLLAAAFNFTNLSLARALQRTKEVGVRKTVGASRGYVAAQFLVEAVVLALVALVLALASLPLLVSLFNGLAITDMAGLQLAFHPLQEPTVLLLFVAVTVGVGVVAGAYPAWALSAPQPAQVIHGRLSDTSRLPSGRSRLRRILLGTQVGLSFVLIVSTLLMYRQSAFELEGDYGFDTDRLVHVERQDAPLDALRQVARSVPGVESTAAVYPLPVSGARIYDTFESGERELRLLEYSGDPDAVVSTLGLELVAGRVPEGSATGILVNETTVRRLNARSPEEAVGTTLQGDSLTYTIRGVLKDFHVNTFRSPIEPVGLFPATDQAQRDVLIRAHPDRHQDILYRLESQWADLDPIHAFDGASYQGRLREMQSSFRDTIGLIGATALFALLITGLGLLGIATYAIRSRVREVGIRKALGASVPQIATLLSKDFLVLAGIALAVGIPVSWLLNDWWLSFWAYRIEIGVGVFAIALLAVLTVTIGTAGLQAWRTARIDPATTLRDE